MSPRPVDCNVSRRRHVKSRTFACDFDDCECFGAGEVQCKQCSRCFHEECVVKARCTRCPDEPELVICDRCLPPAPSAVPVAPQGVVSVQDGSRDEAIVLQSGGIPCSGAGSRWCAPAIQSGGVLDELKSIMQGNYDRIKEVLDGIDSRLTRFSAQMDLNSNDIKGIRVDIADLQARLRFVEDRSAPGTAALGGVHGAGPSTLDADPSQRASASYTSTVEMRDHLYRSCNVLLYNVPVRDSDVADVKVILSKIPNLDLDKISVRRFSKPTSRSTYPPIVVRFSTSAEVIRFVTFRSSLPRGINATADLSPAQRAHRRQLWEEANRHNQEHPDKPKTIKFVRGNLALIDAKRCQRLFPANH